MHLSLGVLFIRLFILTNIHLNKEFQLRTRFGDHSKEAAALLNIYSALLLWCNVSLYFVLDVSTVEVGVDKANDDVKGNLLS